MARARRRRVPPRCGSLSDRARGHQQREPARDARDPAAYPRRARCRLPRPDAAGGSKSVAGIHQGLFRRRRRMPHGVPFSADAADLYGDRARGPVSDNRHHAPDAADSRELPVGDLSTQSRRAHLGDGDRYRAGLSVGGLRRRPACQGQSRDQAAAIAPPRARSAAGRAAELPAALDARHAGHLLR